MRRFQAHWLRGAEGTQEAIHQLGGKWSSRFRVLLTCDLSRISPCAIWTSTWATLSCPVLEIQVPVFPHIWQGPESMAYPTPYTAPAQPETRNCLAGSEQSSNSHFWFTWLRSVTWELLTLANRIFWWEKWELGVLRGGLCQRSQGEGEPKAWVASLVWLVRKGSGLGHMEDSSEYPVSGQWPMPTQIRTGSETISHFIPSWAQELHRKRFAMNELKVTVALILLPLWAVTGPSQGFLPHAEIILKPKNGIHLHLKSLT